MSVFSSNKRVVSGMRVSGRLHLGHYHGVLKNWLKLQKIDNWYLIIPLTVVQSANYSDIECKCVDYSKIMIDVDKPYLFKPRL